MRADRKKKVNANGKATQSENHLQKEFDGSD
jgi:hypothetical protein